MVSPDSAAPLGIGVVGLGPAGMFHVERLGLRADCCIIAGHDDCPRAAQQASGIVPRIVDSSSSLFRDPAVELVVVATPPSHHPTLIIEALAAGKHVMIETPLCLDLASADAIVAASRRFERSVIVSQTRRWESDFLAARQSVEGGALGRLLTVKQIVWQYGLRSQAFGGGTRESARLGVDPLSPHEWRNHERTGGGALWEFGIHQFDQLLQLAGESPASVFAELFNEGQSADVDSGYLALIRFPSGLRSHVEYNRATPVVLQTGWSLVGTSAGYADNTLYHVTSEGEVVDQPQPPVAGEVDEFYAALVRHIREGAPSPVPVEQARQTIALLEAARQSARTGRLVEIVP